MLISAAHAQPAGEANGAISWLGQPLFWTEAGLLILVLVAAPTYAAIRKGGIPKGLNLPAGSVRAMLALLIVGSFVNVLLFGTPVLADNFEQVITAFGTLAGAVTGFYFAGRKTNENSAVTSTEPTTETKQNTGSSSGE